MAYQVNVTTNLDTDFLTQAKKHSNSSHGMSMIALSMLDAAHMNLNTTLVFEDMDTLENCAEQMTAVWDKCASNKVLFRSAKKDGVFLAEFFGKPMSEETALPTTSDEYKNYKVIMDANINNAENVHVYKFYRWLEIYPRVLTLKCVPPEDQKNIDF